MTFNPVPLLASHGLLPERAWVEVMPLWGGFWNDVMRVRSEERDLVVKHYGARSEGWSLFPIVPEVEARAMALLQGRSIAPEFEAFWPAVAGEHGPVLVYCFAQGSPGATDLKRLGQLLRQVHTIPADGFRQTPVNAREILADADRLDDPSDGNKIWMALQALRPPLPDDEPDAARVFLHGDFGSGNVVSGPDGPCIIDWQCPALGDAAEDLWSFLSPAFQAVYGEKAWTTEQVEAFHAGYDDDAARRRLAFIGPFFTWRYVKYALRRSEDLAADDPAAAGLYRAAAEAGLDDLERSQASTPS